jgi:hypothetical protein
MTIFGRPPFWLTTPFHPFLHGDLQRSPSTVDEKRALGPTMGRNSFPVILSISFRILSASLKLIPLQTKQSRTATYSLPISIVLEADLKEFATKPAKH